MKYWVFAILLTLGYTSTAQVKQLWVDYTVQKKQSDHFSWFITAGQRFEDSYGLRTAFITSALQYKMSKIFTASAGFSYFMSSTNKLNVHEVRPWQGIRADFKILPRLLFLNNLRLEERWFLSNGQNEWLYRARFQSGINYTLYQNKESQTSLYTPISFEVFEDLNNHLLINRTRLYVGLGYGVKKNRVELFYISQRQRVKSENHFVLAQDIARIRWIHSL